MFSYKEFKINIIRNLENMEPKASIRFQEKDLLKFKQQVCLSLVLCTFNETEEAIVRRFSSK